MWLCQMEQILDAICHHQWCHPNFSQTNWHRCTCWDAPFWALRTFSLAQLDALLSFELGQQKLFFHPGLDLQFFKKFILKKFKKCICSLKIKALSKEGPKVCWHARFLHVFFAASSSLKFKNENPKKCLALLGLSGS